MIFIYEGNINIIKENERMQQNKLKIVSIDKENMLYVCDDGNEYPLMEGCEDLSVKELQQQLDLAKITTCDILKQINKSDE